MDVLLKAMVQSKCLQLQHVQLAKRRAMFWSDYALARSYKQGVCVRVCLHVSNLTPLAFAIDSLTHTDWYSLVLQ